jgi:4-amino-4-deoxy-L-arabinose transferase-like glycosyltransferase
MTTTKYSYWLMIPILLFVCWASIQYFDEMLWYDEYWSYHFAFGNAQSAPDGDVITRLLDAGFWERHPPGYYLLLHVSGRLFGTSEPALRFLSLFAGLLTLAWVYRIGKSITGTPIGGLGGVITIGITTFFIHYTHDIRMYTVMMMCMSATLATYWELTTRARLMFGTRAIFFISLFWGMFSLYAVALSYAFLGVYHILFASKKRRWLQTLVIMLISVALMAGWIGYYLINQSKTGQLLPGSSPDPNNLMRFFSTFYTNDAPLLLAFIIGYALLHAKLWKRSTLLVGLLASGTLAGLLIISRLTPFYHPRSMMTLFPLVALIGAIAYGAMVKNRARYGFIMGLWLLAFALQWANIPPRLAPSAPYLADWRQVTSFLDDCVRPSDTVLFFFDEVSPELWRDVLDFYLPQTPYRNAELAQVMRNKNHVNNMLSTSTNIWLMTFKRPHFITYRDYVGQFEKAVMGHFALCPIQMDTPDLTLRLYTPINGNGLGCPEPPYTPDVLTPCERRLYHP